MEREREGERRERTLQSSFISEILSPCLSWHNLCVQSQFPTVHSENHYFRSHRSSMAKLYKGLASQCANTGQDASPTTGPEAVRDSGIHSEEILQPYPSAPSSGPAVT